jgi:tetratricopeptide (TPR) repeat protein
VVVRGHGPRRKLTRRERDVLVALCTPLGDGGAFVEPASSRAMAETLGISEAAVKQHLLQLYDKFEIDDGERRRTRLANKAVAAGVVSLAKDERKAGTPEDELALARRAAALRNWPRAFEHLSRMPPDRIEDSADDQELLGEAAVWSGHPEESIVARQRAYALHVKAGRAPRAAVVALQLVINHVMRNQLGQASGWLAKARRHLDGCTDDLARGHLLLTDAVFAMFGGHLEAAVATAEQAVEIADRTGDVDLRALALSVQGYALSVLGRPSEARPKLDEAMAGATGGELGPFATGFVYCRTVCASLDTLDYQRALEWTEAIERTRADACTAGFPGDCRAHRATIYVMRGDWEAGEREARVAVEEARTTDVRHAGIAQNELGMVRLRSGDLAGAEQAFLLAHQFGSSPQPGLALLHSARGDHQQARAMIEAAVEQAPPGTPARAKLVAAMFEIAMGVPDLAAAEAALDQLCRMAGTVPLLRAAAATSEGVLRLAKGDAQAACAALRTAVTTWLSAGAPYEAACARIHLARALVEVGDGPSATLEIGAARPVLQRLGATPALAQADEALNRVQSLPPRTR